MVPIFVSSNFSCSGGFSSGLTSSSFTILGGVNLVTSTFGGSFGGGGGGGGSFFFSGSFISSNCTSCTTICLGALSLMVFATIEPTNIKRQTASIMISALIIRLL